MDNPSNGIRVQFIPPTNWYSRAKWKLLKSYTSHNQNIDVPIGFITDGASVPFFLRWAFPSTGKYFGAAIVHDFVLVTTSDWDMANDEFDNELKALEVSPMQRKIMVGAVRIYAMLINMWNI